MRLPGKTGRSRVRVVLLLCAALALVACGQARSRPLTTNTGGASVAPAQQTTRTVTKDPSLNIPRAVGQLIITSYSGIRPAASVLNAVRSGKAGAVILMGANTAGGLAATRAAVNSLQRAARAGHNPGLLIMTDQEGGLVKRLSGPPAYAAAGMSNPAVANRQGYLAGRLLKQAGVNVDLAPVADVSRTDGFMTQQQRTFGKNPATVAKAACAFAAGLSRAGSAYTLKHFPGLGDAVDSTDDGPVTVTEPAAEIKADDAAYRSCGHAKNSLVMVSSAAYSALTGRLPAVLSPLTYRKLLPADGVNALTVSDAFDTPAISPWPGAARRAVNAGLDMLMYANRSADAYSAYLTLVSDARHGTLSAKRLAAADAKVRALKRTLGLG